MNQQQSGGDYVAFFIIIFIVFAGVWLLWHFQRQLFIYPVFYLRWAELTAVQFCLKLYGGVLVSLGFHSPDFSYLEALRRDIISAIAQPEQVTWEVFANVNHVVGSWVRYPFMLMISAMGYYAYSNSKTLHYRTTYGMDSIKKAESVNYPQISPVMRVNLVKADLEKGPWAMAKSPLGYCQEHKLVFPKSVLDYKVWGLHKSAAYRLITLQLGPQLVSVDKLPIHVKALISVFVARATSKRKVSNDLIRQLSSSSVTGSVDYTGIQETFESLKGEKLVAWALNRHGYVYTFAATLLEAARSDGVLASSEFLWLKIVDRRLWYMINTVGRQTAVVEVAGPYAHWLAEKKLGRAIKTPMIKEAVNALELAVEDVLYVDEGLSWRSKGG